MEINSKYGLPPLPFSSEVFSRHQENAKSEFADYLKDQIENAGGIESEHNATRPNRFSGDLDEIKTKGFSAYMKNLEKEKIEAIREEILERMGLTEEDLAGLPPEQQRIIEDIIAREIQARLAVSSIDNPDESENTEEKSKQIMPGIRPDFAFIPTMEEQGKNDPLSVTEKEKNG